MAEEQAAGNAAVEPQAELEQLRGQLARIEEQRAGFESQATALREGLAHAVARYRTHLLAGDPEVPEELVHGETPQEVETSFASARQMVERMKQGLEARATSERVPAGAPVRGRPDLSSLSPAEKISYALSHE